ncbi:hypothetical protein BDV34DRAFT_227344 [Aspergillus parasiticus]|uniref:Alcohol dehydrogenase-like C-terminal domain-containing protein n=1 Tax=Aspergillus parasiticus TaxID=5067 RepID=A0A5N6DEM2_ASPPA|nr:hypothetical protein BDV34DRAFT_227344 [Aspergillus parasiticus]
MQQQVASAKQQFDPHSTSERLSTRLLEIAPNHFFSTRDTEFGNNIRDVSGGVGVDVVLCSLRGPFLAESSRALAPFGRFLELGKVDVVGSSRIDMALLQSSVPLTYVDLVHLFHRRPKVAADLSLKVHDFG